MAAAWGMTSLVRGLAVMQQTPHWPDRGCLFHPRRVPLARRGGQIVAARSSKAGQPEGQGPLPLYSDMLLQREYELWQRQSGLYEQLLQQHERERAHWATERELWAAQEASLKQEVAELRAQLLFVLSRTGGAAPDGRSSSSSSPFAAQPQEAAPLPGRQPRQLPLGVAAGLTPAEQVQTVIDAAKSGASPAEPLPGAGLSVWQAGVEAGRQGLPRYAAELAAAVAAVEELDVLSEEIDFGALADRLTKGGMAASEAAAQAPAAGTAPAAATAGMPAAPQAQASSISAAPSAAPPPAAAPAALAGEPEAGGPAFDPGPRPSLLTGSDDIYWMNVLHRALVDAGYYPADEDVEDFFFGEGTLSAVLTLQACEGLPETGVVDEATWEVLLTAAGGKLDGLGGELGAAPAAAQASTAAGPAATPKAYRELFAQTVTERADSVGGAVRTVHEVTITDSVQSTPGGGLQEAVTMREGSVVVSAGASGAPAEWPVLMEGDGGKDVHALHVALEQQGCYASEDDVRWWQFGDSTLTALRTFQACSGLPESGIVDRATWRKLLGPNASPSDLSNLRSGDSADEDMAQEGKVWLLGEQRWEDPKRADRKRAQS